MYKIILIASGLFILIASLSKLLEAWIGDSGKRLLAEKVENLWVKVDDMESREVAIAPLKFLENLHNVIFGFRIFSKKAYIRATIISSIVLISLLIISGFYTGTPLSIKTPPWEFWKTYSKVSEAKLGEKKLGGIEYTEEEIKKINEYAAFFSSKTWLIGHSIAFILLTLIVNAFFDATSLSVTRMMLREAISTPNNILIFCILLTNLMIAILLATLSIIIVLMLYVPQSAIALKIVPSLLSDHPAWTIIGIFAAIVGVWNLSGAWLKIIALTTVLPIILLCCSLFFYLIVYPLRNPIHSFVNGVLIKAISYEKGIFAFLFIVLGAIGTIVGIIGNVLK
jgi:hypothetical protein